MDNENDWMDEVEVKPFMEEVNSQIKRLTDLKWKVEQAQEALDKATKEYDDYVHNTFCQVFRTNGLESFRLSDGTRINVITKTSCSINKNEKDKEAVANWLREHGAPELVKSELHVPAASKYKQELDALGIPNEETMTMNTNSVKAWLLDMLGQKGGTAQIAVEDIPKGIHFFQYDDVEILKDAR